MFWRRRMIKYPSFVIVFLIIIVGISLYQIKYFITKNEVILQSINTKISKTRSDLEILKAELSYLKRPDRIERIALNKLELREILPTDIWNLKDLLDATDSINQRQLK
jgi:cell division protein FtsL